jgi:hypothetical protein
MVLISCIYFSLFPIGLLRLFCGVYACFASFLCLDIEREVRGCDVIGETCRWYEVEVCEYLHMPSFYMVSIVNYYYLITRFSDGQIVKYHYC